MIFQLCWATWRVRSNTNEEGFGGGVVWVMSLLTACRWSCGKSLKLECSWLAVACASSVGEPWLSYYLNVEGGLLPDGGRVHVLG